MLEKAFEPKTPIIQPSTMAPKAPVFKLNKMQAHLVFGKELSAIFDTNRDFRSTIKGTTRL